MTYSDSDVSPQMTPRSSTERHRSSSPKEGSIVDGEDVVQGRILWLPPKKDLPGRAVRRAHGKGAVEEGIFNHPVVVISRPAEEGNVVHFHLITSFQGKKLHEIYGKANEFHASRRSWYLPISPTPDHPDAVSKKARKRFPTLELRDDAALRWGSYVNIRHVYKIEWMHLRPYTNPDIPNDLLYRFERDSIIRMLAKGRILTTYVAGEQYQEPVFLRTTAPSRLTKSVDHIPEVPDSRQPNERSNDEVSNTSSKSCDPSSSEEADFLDSSPVKIASIERPPKVPPDPIKKSSHIGLLGCVFEYVFWWPRIILSRLLSVLRHGWMC